MLTVLQEQASPAASTTKAALWSCMFVAIGLGCFCVVFLQISRLEIAGALLTERMRKLSLQSILRQGKHCGLVGQETLERASDEYFR